MNKSNHGFTLIELV
ncbi:MAG TPA: hypothetical protein DCQ77_14510, partial [Betaproteobacteria bacterium]|nr:hypothetical protein [Betaproteobacteria bacterium]